MWNIKIGDVLFSKENGDKITVKYKIKICGVSYIGFEEIAGIYAEKIIRERYTSKYRWMKQSLKNGFLENR